MLDDGRGFDPADVRPGRLGVAVSILDRMRVASRRLGRRSCRSAVQGTRVSSWLAGGRMSDVDEIRQPDPPKHALDAPTSLGFWGITGPGAWVLAGLYCVTYLTLAAWAGGPPMQTIEGKVALALVLVTADPARAAVAVPAAAASGRVGVGRRGLQHRRDLLAPLAHRLARMEFVELRRQTRSSCSCSRSAAGSGGARIGLVLMSLLTIHWTLDDNGRLVARLRPDLPAARNLLRRRILRAVAAPNRAADRRVPRAPTVAGSPPSRRREATADERRPTNLSGCVASPDRPSLRSLRVIVSL